MTLNYPSIWSRLERLSWCALVTTGRTGTDFFQSLLDSHPEIFVFNGKVYFNSFWETAVSVQFSDNPNLSDILDEFIGHHLFALKSIYEPSERKHRLGESENLSIDIDTSIFKSHVINLLDGQPVTSKNVLTAIYASYALCLGQDISQKRVFLHHVHHIRKIDSYMADFPESKIICMTRDPRALYVSGVENWRRDDPLTDNPSYPQYILWRAVDEILPLEKYDDSRLKILKLEDLADQSILKSICTWLDIKFHSSMLESTWAGMRWWGDKISQNKVPKNERGFSKSISTNHWADKLGMLDKYILNYLLFDLLDWYGYSRQRQSGFLSALIVGFLIPFPTIYERRYLTLKYLGSALFHGEIRKFLASFYHPLRRVIWFYRLYYRRNFGAFTKFSYFD